MSKKRSDADAVRPNENVVRPMADGRETASPGSEEPTKCTEPCAPETENKSRPGPKTATGKARASMNALKHGLASQALLIRGEEEADYEGLRQRILTAGHPWNELVEEVLEELTRSIWFRRRYGRCEAAIFNRFIDEAHGRLYGDGASDAAGLGQALRELTDEILGGFRQRSPAEEERTSNGGRLVGEGDEHDAKALGDALLRGGLDALDRIARHGARADRSVVRYLRELIRLQEAYRKARKQRGGEE